MYVNNFHFFQRKNAVSASGHFLSWLAEMSMVSITGVFVFLSSGANMTFAIIFWFYVFLWPCFSLIIYPMIQLISSPILRREARKWIAHFTMTRVTFTDQNRPVDQVRPGQEVDRNHNAKKAKRKKRLKKNLETKL